MNYNYNDFTIFDYYDFHKYITAVRACWWQGNSIQNPSSFPVNTHTQRPPLSPLQTARWWLCKNTIAFNFNPLSLFFFSAFFFFLFFLSPAFISTSNSGRTEAEGGEPLLTLPAECGKKSPRQASSTCRILKRSSPGVGGMEVGVGEARTRTDTACTPKQSMHSLQKNLLNI